MDNLLFGRAPEVIREEVGDSFWNLADFIDKMPHGIIDKKIPGIGATTLEINSKRNSIIVFLLRLWLMVNTQSILIRYM